MGLQWLLPVSVWLLTGVAATTPNVIGGQYRVENIDQGRSRFIMGTFELTFDRELAVGGVETPSGMFVNATRLSDLPLERACNEFNKGVMYLQGAASLTCDTAMGGRQTFGTIPVEDPFSGGRRLGEALNATEDEGGYDGDGEKTEAVIGGDCGPQGCRLDSSSDTRFDNSECYDSGAPIAYAFSPIPADNPMSVLFGTMGKLDMTSAHINGNKLLLGIILEFYDEEMGSMPGIVSEANLPSCTVNLSPDVNPLFGVDATLSDAETGEPVDFVAEYGFEADPLVCNHTRFEQDVAEFVDFLDTGTTAVDSYDAVEERQWQVVAFSIKESISNCMAKAYGMMHQVSEDVTRVTKHCGRPRLSETSPGRRLQEARTSVQKMFPVGKPHSRFFRSALAQVEAYQRRHAHDHDTEGEPRDGHHAVGSRILEDIGGGGGGGGGGMSPNPEWLLDPCCNWDARFTSCCAPRPMQYSRTAWRGINETGVQTQCDAASIGVVTATLGQLSEELNRAGGDDASTDKCAALGSGGGKDAVEDSMSWYRDCVRDIYEETSCTHSGECLSGFCDEGRQKCMVPHDNAELMGSIFFACFSDPTKANVDVLYRVLNVLGVSPSAPPDDARAAIVTAALGESDCVGNTAWDTPGATGRWVWQQANPGCDRTVEFCEYENVFIPGNETLCLADKSCNWDRWSHDMTQERCEGDARGTNVCMECWGTGGADSQSCWSQTQWPRCIKNDYWGSDGSSRCAADGFEWVQEWGWGRCEDTAAASRAECMSGCPFSEDAILSWVDEQRSNSWNRCGGTYCTNTELDNQADCDDTHMLSGCSYSVNVTEGEACPSSDSGWQTIYKNTHIDICHMPTWTWESTYGSGTQYLCIPGGPEAYYASRNESLPDGIHATASPSPSPAPYAACAVPALTSGSDGVTAYCLHGMHPLTLSSPVDGTTEMCVFDETYTLSNVSTTSPTAPTSSSECLDPPALFFACVDSGWASTGECMLHHGTGWIPFDPFDSGASACASTGVSQSECQALKDDRPGDITLMGFETRVSLSESQWPPVGGSPGYEPIYTGCAFASMFADATDPSQTAWFCPQGYRRVPSPPTAPIDQVWCVSTGPGAFISSYDSCTDLIGAPGPGMYVGCSDAGFGTLGDCLAAHPGWFSGAIPHNGLCISSDVPFSECASAGGNVSPLFSTSIAPTGDVAPSSSPTPTPSVTPSVTTSLSMTPSMSPPPGEYVACAHVPFVSAPGFGPYCFPGTQLIEEVPGNPESAVCLLTHPAVAVTESVCADPSQEVYSVCVDYRFPTTAECITHHNGTWHAVFPVPGATEGEDHLCVSSRVTIEECLALTGGNPDFDTVYPFGVSDKVVVKNTMWNGTVDTFETPGYSGCAFRDVFFADEGEDPFCPSAYRAVDFSDGEVWCVSLSHETFILSEFMCSYFQNATLSPTGMYVGCSNDTHVAPEDCLPGWVAGPEGSCVSSAVSESACSAISHPDVVPLMASIVRPVYAPLPSPSPSVTPSISVTPSVTPSASLGPFFGCFYEAFTGPRGYGQCAGNDAMYEDPRDAGDANGGTRAVCLDTNLSRESCSGFNPLGCVDLAPDASSVDFCADEHDATWAPWMGMPSMPLVFGPRACASGEMDVAACGALSGQNVSRYIILATDVFPLAHEPNTSYSGCAFRPYAAAADAAADCPYGLVKAPSVDPDGVWCYAPVGSPAYRTAAECDASSAAFLVDKFSDDGNGAATEVTYSACWAMFADLTDDDDAITGKAFWSDVETGGPATSGSTAVVRADLSFADCSPAPPFTRVTPTLDTDGWASIEAPVPTPTSSTTPTATRSVSVTGTPSPTVSDSSSISETTSTSLSGTRSVSPSISDTPSVSLTPSVSGSMGESSTPTASRTPSRSETSSVSQTSSITMTPSTSLSGTRSPTPSPLPYADCAYESFIDPSGWATCLGEDVMFEDATAANGAACLMQSGVTAGECGGDPDVYIGCIQPLGEESSCDSGFSASWSSVDDAGTTSCGADTGTISEAQCDSDGGASTSVSGRWLQVSPTPLYTGCYLRLNSPGDQCGHSLQTVPTPPGGSSSFTYCAVTNVSSPMYKSQSACEAEGGYMYAACTQFCSTVLQRDDTEEWATTAGPAPTAGASGICYHFDMIQSTCTSIGGTGFTSYGTGPITAPLPTPSPSPSTTSSESTTPSASPSGHPVRRLQAQAPTPSQEPAPSWDPVRAVLNVAHAVFGTSYQAVLKRFANETPFAHSGRGLGERALDGKDLQASWMGDPVPHRPLGKTWTMQHEQSFRASRLRSDAKRRLEGHRPPGDGVPVWWGGDTQWRIPHYWHTKFHTIPNPEYNETFATTFQRETTDTHSGAKEYHWDTRAEEFIWAPDETASGACVTSDYWQLTQPGAAFEGDSAAACASLGVNNEFWSGTWYVPLARGLNLFLCVYCHVFCLLCCETAMVPGHRFSGPLFRPPSSSWCCTLCTSPPSAHSVPLPMDSTLRYDFVLSCPTSRAVIWYVCVTACWCST